MNKRLEGVLSYMPDNLKRIFTGVFLKMGDNIQEIRIRSGLPLVIETSKGNFAVLPDGKLSSEVNGAYIAGADDVKRVFYAVCENSIYAFADDIRQGFVTIRGGHRVGITGRATVTNGKIESFREITSLNIRIAREVIGAADSITEHILKPNGILNTLIVSPPMGGKTTVLRDLTRQISDRGIKTAVVDERGELASIFHGVPQNNVGVHTDVIENVSKAEGMTMLLRTMSPELIVTDEISTKRDAEAISRCFGTGVAVVATAHGNSAKEIMKRRPLQEVLGDMGFRQIILLKKEIVGTDIKILGEVTVIDKW
ncbi:MAG: stage III sporulation protein AA [Clostridia bacterium]|nr:stage III sporulation protein AA [Clostridia bacterium]